MSDEQVARLLERIERERHVDDWGRLLANVARIRDSHPDSRIGQRLAVRYLTSVHREFRRVSR